MKKILFLLMLGLSFPWMLIAQTNPISGVVTSSVDGEALIGVSVIIKGSSAGTATNVNGAFQLNARPNDVLVFSYLGFITKEIPVGNTLDFQVVLDEDQQVLNEVVVIGYGVQKKSVVTAAISKVKASDLEKVTFSRIENVLNGQISGVSMTQNSGAPGSELAVRVRGIGTTGNNSPLFIVDGMAVDGGIRNLNPADVESVEVLKDAASAAVYGTRGGNGVILITTKRGATGKPKITYNMNLGWQNPWRKMPLLNSEQYMLIINELYLNNNQATLFTSQDIADARAGRIPNTDWQDVAFNKNAPVTDHQVSIQGGNANGSYFLSLGRFSQDGILGGNYGAANYDRWTIRANSDYEIFKVDSRKFLNKIKVGVNTTYSRANSTGIGNNSVFGSALASAIALPPTLTPYLSEAEGQALLAEHPTALVYKDRVLTPSPSYFQEIRNPLALYLHPEKSFNDEDKIIGTFWGELNVLPSLVFRSSYGFDLAFWGNNSYRFPYFISYNVQGLQNESTSTTYAASEMNRGFTRQIENTLTYDFNINGHSITLLAGQSARDGNTRQLTGRGYDLKIYDPNMAIINNARMDVSIGGRTSGGSTSASALASYFGRVSYNYAERYMFQATVRKDGSYIFGDKNKWGTFPSFSVGWNVWNEPFLESAKPLWWDALKLRGSWGINGSDRINAYAYMSLMESNLNYYFGGGANNQLNYGISAGRLPNPYIHWEESRQTNLGADFAFLRSALTFSFDWFTKRTVDMLRDAANVPSYVGQSPPRVNAGIVDNKGIEMDLSYRFSPAKDLNIGLKANASWVKNTIVDFGNASGENSYGGIGAAGVVNFIYQKNGFPNPFFYGHVTDGIIQTQVEADEYNAKYDQKAKPGDVKFKDINGDSKIDNDDRTMIGKPVPDWVFGFTLTADYKGFDFYLFLQGVQGNDIFDIVKRTDIPRGNLPAWIMDRWTGEGTSNKYPRLVSSEDNNNWRPSDLYIKDGSFLRVKNIQFGYTFPQYLTRKISIDRLRLWIGAENLLTFTKYDGFDPEIGDQQIGVSMMGNYPVARMINCGVGISF
jgi:TonB-linked SusC/RagA family outer membrane protein